MHIKKLLAGAAALSKKDGYKAFNNPSFTNQGQCVSYVNTQP